MNKTPNYCGQCVFAHQRFGSYAAVYFDCHRFPPQLVVRADKVESHFPSAIRHCGEFKPKDPA